MNHLTLLGKLIEADSIKKFEAALAEYKSETPHTVGTIPFGRKSNNRGAIEVASDSGRSAMERITNAFDAILELEYMKHKGLPNCRTPREAAGRWLGVPEREGLAKLTVKERQDLADRITMRLEPGEGSHSRILTVIDKGSGILPNKMEDTILSLNESNKIEKHYLVGTYGQGGSSTFAFSKYSLIASRYLDSNEVAFTIVWYLDLPAERYKTGHYLYMVENEKPFVANADGFMLEHGTLVKHFGYDLSTYTSSIGPKSLYGILQRVLFEPITPVWFENKVNGWRRVIKGARNALNGAIDTEEDGKGPNLAHHIPLFNISLGDHGDIGIEYWVLKKEDDKKKGLKNPTDSFVNSKKPIILTHNGQNQGELSEILIRKEADLPFLRNLIICHINCDKLTAMSKRNLFSSTREHSREGQILKLIQEELINCLKADDELKRLNEEVREKSLQDEDESAEKLMRKQVMKLLSLYGSGSGEEGGDRKKEGSGDKRPSVPKPPVKPVPISPNEPPTYIKIIWESEKAITFHPTQRRYIRVETDANSIYHDPNKPLASKINIIVGDNLKIFGTSPLRGGRMRVGIECNETVVIGSTASIRIELYRTGLSTISDEKNYVILEKPEVENKSKKSSFPDFKVIPVTGPEHENWDNLTNSIDDDDISKYACNGIMNDGSLYLYYSTVFPKFKNEFKNLETQNPLLSQSFTNRYKIWLVVHSLLMIDQEPQASPDEDLF